MTSTTWTLPPTGSPGRAVLPVRAAGRTFTRPGAARLRAVPAPAVRVQAPGICAVGTPLPGTHLMDTGAIDTRATYVGAIVVRAVDMEAFSTPATELCGFSGIAQVLGVRPLGAGRVDEHNGTTLGIHRPGSPSS